MAPAGRRCILVPILELTGQSCGEGRDAYSSNAILGRQYDALITALNRRPDALVGLCDLDFFDPPQDVPPNAKQALNDQERGPGTWRWCRVDERAARYPPWFLLT